VRFRTSLGTSCHTGMRRLPCLIAPPCRGQVSRDDSPDTESPGVSPWRRPRRRACRWCGALRVGARAGPTRTAAPAVPDLLAEQDSPGPRGVRWRQPSRAAGTGLTGSPPGRAADSPVTSTTVAVRPVPADQAVPVAEVLADRSRRRGSAALDTADTGAAGLHRAGQGRRGKPACGPVAHHQGSALGCPPRRSAASCGTVLTGGYHLGCDLGRHDDPHL